MVLDAECSELPGGKSLAGVVVEIQMCQLDVLPGQRVHIYAKTVILAGDFDFACVQILDGMIGATVAELELVGFGAHRQSEDLMTQADAEDRDSAE